MIYLTEQDVEQLVSMPVAVEILHEAFRQLYHGNAENVPRVRAKAKGIVLHSMSAAADYLGLVGWKQYTTTRRGARFLVGLYQQTTGELVSLIEADRLGQIRTGAASGLALSCLAPTATSIGMIGTGWQAESQLEAAAAACDLRRAIVFSRREDRLKDFCERMSERLQLEVAAANSAEEAVRNQPVVITITTSREPVFEGRWLQADAVVCAAGSNWLNKTELDRETIRRAGLIVCDSRASCQAEAGDLVPSLEAGEFQWQDACELAELVDAPDRADESAGQIRIFKSVGMAIQDVALGSYLLQQYGRQLAE